MRDDCRERDVVLNLLRAVFCVQGTLPTAADTAEFEDMLMCLIVANANADAHG